ncbi:MAG: hypothetical protein JWM80_1373 [Cyanobacteria bacterium RYN_339]|nr:hypothetical protein [Cyanobacteria bacterium RYN_339]
MKMLRALLAAAVILPAVGCAHQPLVSTAAAKGARDWSGIGAMATHKPNRAPKRQSADTAGDLTKFLCNAATEAKAPEGFVLSKETQDFRKAMDGQGDKQRMALAKQIAGDQTVMGAFGNWSKLSEKDQMATLDRVVAMEGKVMDFTPPPMSTATGVPETGTLAYFQGGRDGIGKVVLYPEAIAKGDRWTALATVTHEMRHAYQFQLVMKAANKKIAEGTVDMTLAYGFYQANQVISKVGGEDNLSYGDYSHLNNEYDAFATGNMIAAVVSKGEANTSGLGFVDVQYKPSGEPYAGLAFIESKVGAAKLLEALNNLELKIIKGNKDEAVSL